MKKYLFVVGMLSASAGPLHAQQNLIYFDRHMFQPTAPRCTAAFCKADRAHSAGHETQAIKIATEALNEGELSPMEHLAFLWLRGDAFEKRGQFDDAIADETSVIASNGDQDIVTVAYLTRGAAYFNKYDDVKAMADFNKVVARSPDAFRGYQWRGWVYAMTGNEPAALADFEAAEKRTSATANNVIQSYASMFFLEEKFGQAAKAYSSALQLDPTDPGLVLWLHLARVNAGADDGEEFKTNVTHANLEEWPGPLIKMLLGQMSEEAASQSLNDGKFKFHESRDWLCEQMFVSAEWRRFVKKAPASARPLYERVISSCPRSDEVQESRNALKHLGA